MGITKFSAYDALNIEYELTITHNDLSKLLDLKIVRKLRPYPKNMSKIKKLLSEKLKYPVKDLRYDDETKQWMIFFDHYKHYEFSLLNLIRRALKNNNIEKMIKINLYPTNLDLLEPIMSKIHRIQLMDFDSKQGFYITKLSSIRYINFITSIVDGPLLSIIRFSSENKAEVTERKNFHIDGISMRKYGERDLSFWINNYIKSKRKPTDAVKSTNDEFQRSAFNADLVVLSLISSLRGLISENGYLLPWPFSSFELATNSHKLYTVFPIAMKIENIKKKYTFDIKNIFDNEINEINYDNDVNLAKIKVSVNLYNINKENDKLKRKSLELITTNDLVEALELEKNKNFIGIVIGQTFKSVYDYPLFLIHAYSEEESKLINLINIMNNKISIDILKHPFCCNNIINIKNLIYETAYNNSKKHLVELKGNDELLCTITEIMKTYKNILEDAIGNSLQPTYVFNANI